MLKEITAVLQTRRDKVIPRNSIFGIWRMYVAIVTIRLPVSSTWKAFGFQTHVTRCEKRSICELAGKQITISQQSSELMYNILATFLVLSPNSPELFICECLQGYSKKYLSEYPNTVMNYTLILCPSISTSSKEIHHWRSLQLQTQRCNTYQHSLLPTHKLKPWVYAVDLFLQFRVRMAAT
jgi:hypothetical protein